MLPKMRVTISMVLFSALFFSAASPARAAMKLLTPEVGWLAGGKGIRWTTDAGASWKDITPPLGPRARVVSVFFLDTLNGWALISYQGEDGTHSHFDLASTSTAGTNWSVNTVTLPDPYARSQALAGGGRLHYSSRNFHFELPLHPKSYASYPVMSTANSSGLFEVVVRHILAVLRSRCAGFACPACRAADTYPARPLLST